MPAPETVMPASLLVVDVSVTPEAIDKVLPDVVIVAASNPV